MVLSIQLNHSFLCIFLVFEVDISDCVGSGKNISCINTDRSLDSQAAYCTKTAEKQGKLSLSNAKGEILHKEVWAGLQGTWGLEGACTGVAWLALRSSTVNRLIRKDQECAVTFRGRLSIHLYDKTDEDINNAGGLWWLTCSIAFLAASGES